MKKQFFRVKQLADQRFLRAEKTEVLSDDLQDAEKKVEFIKTSCFTTGKKLSSPISSQDASAKEKRLRKTSDFCLGTTLLECASAAASADDNLPSEHLLRQVVTDCGKLQICLANATVEYEMRIESQVVEPLLGVCDNDYPNIQKVKKTLSKLILDMDSARTRYQQAASKHNSGSASASKSDLIKDELEEAETKVEQCRDSLACEMLQLISREAELSNIILEYANLQRNHHKAAIAILDKIIPEMENKIRESPMKPVFGRPLEEHLRVTGRKIAFPIELCVCGILELGIAEEGLFRVAPGASKLRRMKLSLDAHQLQFETALQFRDPHVFAGVLKSYLRELPEPLLTHKLYDQWMNAARVMSTGNQDEGLSALWNVLHCLPQTHYDNIHYLVKFLSSLASNKQSNKMTPQNIAIVMAPNLIWSPSDDTNNIGMNMNVANLHSIIVDSLVTFANWFFPGDVDFYVTIIPAFLNGHTNDQLNESQVDIKRTQSNDSLSDHNSPPQGSPKPAVRIRKHHKAAAPNPPGHNETKRRDDDKINEKRRNSMLKEERPKSVANAFDEPKRKSEIEAEPTATPDAKTKKESPRETKREDSQLLTSCSAINPTSPDSIELKFNESFTDLPPRESDSTTSGLTTSPERRLGDLDKRTSKSGEDIRQVKLFQDVTFATLDRKKPPRPTPAPRSFILSESSASSQESKPAIPERPAALQRPLSSSFRINRNNLESPTDPEDRTLERARLFCVDKQQVSFVNVSNDKVPTDKKPGERERRESGDKPEKPKKPDTLCQSGHQRAASEGSIIETGVGTEKRPPRPTPPPPPIPSPVKIKDSTDL